MKCHVIFQGEIITRQRKYIDEIYNSSPTDSLGQFHPKWAQSIIWVNRLKVVQIRTIQFSTAGIWLKYCRNGVKHYPINQSINFQKLDSAWVFFFLLINCVYWFELIWTDFSGRRYGPLASCLCYVMLFSLLRYVLFFVLKCSLFSVM